MKKEFNLSTETKRFLNHIERERDVIVESYESTINHLNSRVQTTELKLKKNEYMLNNMTEELTKHRAEILLLTEKYNKLMNATTNLIPKIRVDIYSGKTTTPRWFESGKWWDRETGGLDNEFVAEMTEDEKIEAIDFYGKTKLKLMLPRSNRDLNDN